MASYRSTSCCTQQTAHPRHDHRSLFNFIGSGVPCPETLVTADPYELAAGISCHAACDACEAVTYHRVVVANDGSSDTLPDIISAFKALAVLADDHKSYQEQAEIPRSRFVGHVILAPGEHSAGSGDVDIGAGSIFVTSSQSDADVSDAALFSTLMLGEASWLLGVGNEVRARVCAAPHSSYSLARFDYITTRISSSLESHDHFHA